VISEAIMKATNRPSAIVALAGLVLVAMGCAHQTDVVPPLPAEIGPPVSSYGIPAEGPRGTVHLVSLGREVLPTASGEARVYLHLRLAAINGSDDQTWILDPREQLLRDGAQILAPAFAESSTGEPRATLGRGARGFLDLYYAMVTPAGKEPARVSLAWRVRRGDQLFAQATDFERSGPDAGYAYYQPNDREHVAFDKGTGSWWWSDYYFWHDDRVWWPYQQAAFSRRYPRHREQWVAARQAHQREYAERQAVSQPNDGGYWRGIGQNLSQTTVDNSNWRGVPERPSVASSPVVDSSSGTSGTSGGDGKSSWRGGSGP
jgi:hypothetical protein